MVVPLGTEALLGLKEEHSARSIAFVGANFNCYCEPYDEHQP